jgi:hypothetical protein
MAHETGNNVASEYNFIPGMTLRDYFAAKAMMVILTDPKLDGFKTAVLSYKMADFMLKARQS